MVRSLFDGLDWDGDGVVDPEDVALWAQDVGIEIESFEVRK